MATEATSFPANGSAQGSTPGAATGATSGNDPEPSSQPSPADSSGGGEESRTSNPSKWLAALRTIVGLENPTLRDTIADALKTSDTGDDAFTSQERDMLLRLLQYNALRVEDVMVPRADIIAVDENESIGAVLQAFVEAGVSRMPLFHETLDDPRGMIHIKDAVKWLTQSASDKPNGAANATGEFSNADSDDTQALRKTFPELDLARVALSQPVATAKVGRKVIFVPPSMPAMNLLLRMQSTRMHMALVVDEYGGTDGLVTIEDLIEQIVGQIEDEHDEDEASNISVDPRLGMVAAARTPIEELEKHLAINLALDEDDDVDTLGGLVIALAGSVPVRGEIVRHPANVEFEVLDADPRRIKRVRVIRRAATAMEPSDPPQPSANPQSTS